MTTTSTSIERCKGSRSSTSRTMILEFQQTIVNVDSRKTSALDAFKTPLHRPFSKDFTISMTRSFWMYVSFTVTHSQRDTQIEPYDMTGVYTICFPWFNLRHCTIMFFLNIRAMIEVKLTILECNTECIAAIAFPCFVGFSREVYLVPWVKNKRLI